MIRSRPVSCSYCHIINLSITTITLGIAQKMQEAERTFNQHVHNVGDIRCIHDDLKSSCFLYLLSHKQREYYHNHIRYCTENVCIVINLTTIMISHAIIESCIFCYFLPCFCCLRYLVLGIWGPRSPSISLIPCCHTEGTDDEIHLVITRVLVLGVQVLSIHRSITPLQARVGATLALTARPRP